LATVASRDAFVTGTKQPKGQLPVTMVQSAAVVQLWCVATKAPNSSFASQVARSRGDLSALAHSLAVAGWLEGVEEGAGAADAVLLGEAGVGSGIAVVPEVGGEGEVTGSAAGGGALERAQPATAAAKNKAARNENRGARTMRSSVVEGALPRPTIARTLSSEPPSARRGSLEGAGATPARPRAHPGARAPDKARAHRTRKFRDAS
jgi:hypothetical protein